MRDEIREVRRAEIFGRRESQAHNGEKGILDDECGDLRKKNIELISTL